jgi:hypothetical protein
VLRAVRGVQCRGGVPLQQDAQLAHPDCAAASVLLTHMANGQPAGVDRPQPLANVCKRDLQIPEIGYQTCNIKSGPAAFGRLYQLPILSTSRTATVYGTVVAISIRSSNFGWARPNRVVSQAVFQKIATGHPKFGSEREVRSSPWEFSALTASRLDAPRVPKNPKGKQFSWPHRRAAHTGHTHRDERPGGPRGAGSPAPSPPSTASERGYSRRQASGLAQ